MGKSNEVIGLKETSTDFEVSDTSWSARADATEALVDGCNSILTLKRYDDVKITASGS